LGQNLKITAQNKKQYQEEGYFILQLVIHMKELKFIRNECDQLIRLQEQEMDRLGTNELNLSRRNSRYFVFLAYKNRPELGKFIFGERMAELCQATIGNNALLFWEQFVAKSKDKRSEFTWHQDSGYVDHPHKPYVNFWIPLDDVTEANGTIYILPFSRAGTREKVEHKPIPGSKDRVGYFGNDPGIPVICPAGSIAVFSSTSFHRSGANTTDQMRRAYSIQFSPEPVLEADGSLKGLAEPFLKDGKRVR